MNAEVPRVCSVTLLARQPVQVTQAAVLESLEKQCGRVKALPMKDDKPLWVFGYMDYPVSYAEKTVPAQTIISLQALPALPDDYAAALQQTRGWKEAKTVVAECRHSIMITDMMAGGLERKVRLDWFHRVVGSVLEITSCDAIYWRNSDQFMNPAEYRQRLKAERFNPLTGALNVRMFTIQNDVPGATLMDTMGLATFGLPDIQCHFTGLDPNKIGPILYNVGNYLFTEGDVINDGETVPGIAPDSKWRCQHEKALVGPEREVLDINPGKPYALGKRG